MKKSAVVPKFVVAAVLLIIAIIISVPCAAVTLNRLFGGGILDFNSVKSAELIANRPIEGGLYLVSGCVGENLGQSDSDSATLKKGSYYYLVPLGGKEVKDGTTQLILVKTVGNSDVYSNFNDLWRASSGKDSAVDEVELSGVVKPIPVGADEVLEVFCKNNGLGDYQLSAMMIDCTNSVSSICTRFYISLVFYVCFVIALLLAISSVKRNMNIDDIEHRRAITQTVQDIRSGANEPDSSGEMYGDSSAEYQTYGSQQQGGYSAEQQSVQYQGQQHSSENQQSDYDDGGFFR